MGAGGCQPRAADFVTGLGWPMPLRSGTCAFNLFVPANYILSDTKSSPTSSGFLAT